MLVSYYYNSDKPEGLPHNREEYGEPSELKQMELKEMLANCTTISDGASKHGAGQIYAFIADKFYRKDTIVEDLIQTDGACLCDVDELTEDEKTSIYEHWDEITNKLPNIQTIWKSYSGNLHVCFWTESLTADEYYKQELLGLIYFGAVVKKVCGITLNDKSSGVKANLDTHNSSISQRFFLNKINTTEVLWNEHAQPMNFAALSKEQKEECSKYWPYIVNAYVSCPSTSRTYINKNSVYELGYVDWVMNNGSVSQIEYIPHRTRWNVYTCFAELFEDEEKTNKEWEKFAKRIPENGHHPLSFYLDEPNRNRWFTIRHPHFNIDILAKYGYNIKKQNNEKYCVKKGHWLTEYKDEILDFISKYRRCEILSPTGTGKTTFINGDYTEDIVLGSPFSLASELNAIAIVPFVVTNKLYDSMIEVNADWNGEIKSDRQYVMVWDQALKHWDKIKDRTLIIDEAHCLFLDRTYRDVAVKLMNKIKEDDCKIVLFTATPSGEGEELNCETMEFTNERDVININFIKMNSVDRAQLGTIKKCMDSDKIDKIVLFDDNHARKIYENLMIEGKYINDIAYIRADTKDSEDFTYLREKEQLNKKLTICTCVAFNGLNFKNKNENILVITSYKEGDTTAAKIIQESGRIRNSNVSVIVYFDGKEYESTLENRIEKAEIMNDAVLKMDMPDSLLSYDRRLLNGDTVDALRRIESRLQNDSKLEVIIDKLVDTGYFIVYERDYQSDDYSKGDRLVLAIKKKQSEEFIEDLLNGSFCAYRPDSYKDRWYKRIKRIVENNSYTGIDLNLFKEMVNKKNKNTLIETVIEKVEKIIKVALLSDIEWNNYTSKIDILKAALKNEVDRRDVSKNYKKNVLIRNKYKDKVMINESNIVDLNGVTKDLFEELEEQYNMEKAKRAAVKKKQVRSINDNKVFESIDDAAKYYDKSRVTINKWIKEGKIVYV